MQKPLFLKILAPIDGSEHSNKALLHACELAKNFKAQLITLYVIDKSLTINFLDRKEYLTLLRKYGKKVLQKGQKITTSNGMDSKQIIKEGNVVKEIINVAKNEKCNLIVVGSKGLGAALRFLLGSVSSKLANNAPCSVLIIK